jgi:uncharacterized damage-inducible protein DinB
MKHTAWIERKFSIIDDSGLLPDILERLVGTTLRIEALIKNRTQEVLTFKQNGKWSIQEEIGHLGDLEPLWLKRVHELINKVTVLSAADMSNQKTHTANHNLRTSIELIEDFKSQRIVLIETIRKLSDEQIEHEALHPRLKSPMKIVDLAYFVAEHDDHHLANMRAILINHGK